MTQTRWLTDEQQSAWRALITMSGTLQAVLDRQLQHTSGMPHAYYLVLAMLSEAEGRSLRMSELAGLLNASASRTSHAVARLEEAGWVRRERHPTDGRGYVAVLTDVGFDVLVAAAPGHVEAVHAGVFDPLRPDQVELLRVIALAISAGLEAVDQRQRALPRTGPVVPDECGS
ncbi:MarR family winged helix-turn-helix transcriptional regulator [Pengzhenrongella frigida]|uniref:MarR family transcriptional regulator n=1 Tax=Pengzhenrongella frigida TaxID=1259133 RepID=A0A4Q5N2S5_9MICO|nr:MarR family transcriptional regulator [Cellulomonas sp. HLT2-17]RYV50381.1 MarR family transcriptional regulator [Cellulomonas sp. HLT2-17]